MDIQKYKKKIALIVSCVIFTILFILSLFTNIFEPVVGNIRLEIYRERYPDIRFGDDKNTILLDVEWHTYETYISEFLPKLKRNYEEYKKSDEYMNKSDEYKNNYNNRTENNIAYYEQNAELIKDNKCFEPRFIDGKEARGLNHYIGDISSLFNADGYFIWEIYPFFTDLIFFDEINYKYFEGDTITAMTLREYRYKLKHEIIPICDSLLERGVISQKQYDIWTMDDPVDILVKRFFGNDYQ